MATVNCNSLFWLSEFSQAPLFSFRRLLHHDLQELLIIFFPWLLLLSGVGVLTIFALDPLRTQGDCTPAVQARVPFFFSLLPPEYQNFGTLLVSSGADFTFYNIGYAGVSYGIFLHLNFFRNCLRQVHMYALK